MEYQHISALTTLVVDSLSNRYYWNILVYKKQNADHFSENNFFFVIIQNVFLFQK